MADDIVIRIRPEDEGAAELIQKLVREIQAATKSTVEISKARRLDAAAAREQAAALREKTRQEKESAAATQRAVQAELAARRQSLREIQAEERLKAQRRRSEEQAARVKERAARAEQQAANAQARQAAAVARQQQQAAKAAERAAQEKARAEQRAARQQQQAANAAQRAAAQQARQQAAATRLAQQQAAQQARLAVQQQRVAQAAAAAQSRQQIAQARIAAQQNRLAQQQVVAQNRLALAHHRAAIGADRQSFSYKALYARLIALRLAFEAVGAINAYIQRGLEFNQVVESASLGIASLISAQSKLHDSNGTLLTGTRALAAAQTLAADQILKLRIAGIETAATTEQLIDAFQQAVGAGIKTGLTLDQIRKFTVQIAQAAGAIGLPFNQLNQEVRSILDATIDRNSRIAKALQLTNEEIRLAKEQGRLAELLNKRFEAFTLAGEQTVLTFAAVKSNISDMLDLFAGAQFEPFFNRFKEAGLELLGTVFDIKKAKIRDEFLGLIGLGQQITSAIGSALADALEFGIDRARDLAEWFENNEVAIQNAISSADTLVRSMGGMVTAMIGVVDQTLRWTTESRTAIAIFRTISTIVETIADNMQLIATILGGMLARRLIVAAIANPYTAAVAGVLLLTGAIMALRKEEEILYREQTNRIRQDADRTVKLSKLTQQYNAQIKLIQSDKLKGKDLIEARIKLKEIEEELLKIAPELSKAFADQANSMQDLARISDDLARSKINTLIDQSIQLQDEISRSEGLLIGFRVQLQNAQADAIREAGKSRSDFIPRGQTAKIEQQIKDLEERLPLMRDRLREVERAASRASAEYLKAQALAIGVGAALDPIDPNADASGRRSKVINDEVDRARGELRAVKREVSAQREVLRGAFERNLVSAEEYYEALYGLTLRQIEAEENLAKAQLVVAIRRKDAGEIDRFTTEIESFEDARLEAAAETDRKIFDARRKQFEDMADLQIELLAVDGNIIQSEAERLAIEYRDALTAALVTHDARFIQDTKDLFMKKFMRLQQDSIEQQITDIENIFQASSQTIDLQVRARQLTDIDAQLELSKAYSQQADSLEGVVRQLQRMATAFPDDQILKTRIEELTLKIKELRTEAALTATALLIFALSAADALETALGSAFESIITHTKSVTQAFLDMAREVVAAIARIIAQMLAQLAVQQILAAIGIPGLSGGGSVTGNKTINIQGKAEGGLISRIGHSGKVHGPGTSTNDRAGLFALSRGEYVINARASRAYRPLIEAINEYGRTGIRPSALRGMAQGGPITEIGRSMAGRDGADGNAIIGLEEGLVFRHMKSRQGEKIFIEQLRKNRNVIRALVPTGNR